MADYGRLASERMEVAVAVPGGAGRLASERMQVAVAVAGATARLASERMQVAVAVPGGAGRLASERMQVIMQWPLGPLGGEPPYLNGTTSGGSLLMNGNQVQLNGGGCSADMESDT